MPTYKLTYFPVTALAEPIRWLLSYGGEEFDDIRFDRKNWPEIKKEILFGQVPTLDIDGEQTWQHVAICRYLARRYKLVPTDEMDLLRVDMIVDTMNDFRSSIAAYFYDGDQASKQKKKEPLIKETLPFYLSRFDKIVADNNGFFAAKQLTWADLYYVAVSEYLEFMTGEDHFKDYPNLSALKKTVQEIPAIKKWMEVRPDSVYPN